jgi:hypothetical protein
VPLYFLSQRRHVPVAVITALVRRHGGIVERTDQARGEWSRAIRLLLTFVLTALVVYVLIRLSPLALLAVGTLVTAACLLAPEARRRG